MAQVLLLKISATTGLPTEHSSGSDDVTFNSVTANTFIGTLLNSPLIDLHYLAGVTCAARDVVYISGSGAVSPADCNAEATARAIGFASTVSATGATVFLQCNGVLGGFASLLPGARYYLSEVAGGATNAIVTTSGAEVIQVGYAGSTTQMQIMIEHLGVRA